MEHYFGEIENDEMVLNELGLTVNLEWAKTPEIRPDMNLALGEFVVMPNHFHGTIMIGDNEFNTGGDNTLSNPTAAKNKFGKQSKNLGSITRGFKSSVTTYARTNNIEFKWQGRFHDHVIRSREEYERISDYIKNNPANWKKDKFFG